MSENQSTNPKWYQTFLKALVDWFKINGGTYVANLIMKYGGTYIKSAIGGFGGKLAVVFFNYVVVPFLKTWTGDLIIDKVANKYLKEYMSFIRKKGITHEEFINAGNNFFNRP